SLGFSTFNNMMYMSLTMTSAMNVAIVQASLPFFVFLLNFIIYRLNPTLFQIVGFPITVIGVLMITSKGSLEVLQSLTFNMGDLLMIAAIAVYGVYSVFLNKKPDVHWLSFIAVLASSAFIISLFYSGYEVATDTAIWPDLTGTLIVFYTAIFPSILSQVFWIRSVELIGSNSSAIWINVVPVFGTLLAILIVGERFQIFHGLGMLLIIGGVWIAQRKKTNP
ncbi:MAG: DMT family transporter, partial [Nitratireductor sp.]